MARKNNVTIKSIAAACGVSAATVSRVLNNIQGSCSAETEARIRQSARELGYVPNIMARSLVTRRTGLVAVLVPDIHYYFFQEFYFGLEEYFGKFGLYPLLCNTQQNAKRERQYLQSMSNGLADGMIVSTLNCKENNEELLRLKREGVPIITLERYGEELEECCNIRLDNAMACEMAVDYLYQQGHKKIAYISGPDNALNSRMRYEGYRKGMQKCGLEVNKELIGHADYQFDKSVLETLRLIESQKFSALIAANDLMCLGACKAFRKKGMEIPKDISIVGVDNTSYLELYQPRITAISLGGYEVGKWAGECMIRMLNGDDMSKMNYVFSPELKQGKSVLPA